MAIVRHVEISFNPITKLVMVHSPYNPDFTEGAKTIGGKWNSIGKCWSFPATSETLVRALCSKIYGVTDGAPKLTRSQLEANLARHLMCVVEIQDALAQLDGEEGAP